jgi:hypothetical protein
MQALKRNTELNIQRISSLIQAYNCYDKGCIIALALGLLAAPQQAWLQAVQWS